VSHRVLGCPGCRARREHCMHFGCSTTTRPAHRQDALRMHRREHVVELPMVGETIRVDIRAEHKEQSGVGAEPFCDRNDFLERSACRHRRARQARCNDAFNDGDCAPLRIDRRDGVLLASTKHCTGIGTYKGKAHGSYDPLRGPPAPHSSLNASGTTTPTSDVSAVSWSRVQARPRAPVQRHHAGPSPRPDLQQLRHWHRASARTILRSSSARPIRASSRRAPTSASSHHNSVSKEQSVGFSNQT
jgi:hypothetical protein